MSSTQNEEEYDKLKDRLKEEYKNHYEFIKDGFKHKNDMPEDPKMKGAFSENPKVERGDENGIIGLINVRNQRNAVSNYVYSLYLTRRLKYDRERCMQLMRKGYILCHNEEDNDESEPEKGDNKKRTMINRMHLRDNKTLKDQYKYEEE
jgi:hypothetical protein